MLHEIRNARDVIGYLISFAMIGGIISGIIYLVNGNSFGYIALGIGFIASIVYIAIVKEKLKF